jgi:hypothetical protein
VPTLCPCHDQGLENSPLAQQEDILGWRRLQRENGKADDSLCDFRHVERCRGACQQFAKIRFRERTGPLPKRGGEGSGMLGVDFVPALSLGGSF